MTIINQEEGTSFKGTGIIKEIIQDLVSVDSKKDILDSIDLRTAMQWR